MNSQFRLVFVIFCLVAVLIFTVYLRNAENRIFYKLCLISVEQEHLKQKLWQKQLQIENMINPAAVSEKLNN